MTDICWKYPGPQAREHRWKPLPTETRWEWVRCPGCGQIRRMADIYGKGAKGKATKLHALIVRSRGVCEACGSGNQLQCAHIISRKYSNTRTSLDNAFCLCASCHRTFTDNPVDFGKFVTDMIGEERYDELVKRRNLIAKVDWDTEAARLVEIAREKGLV